MKLKVLLIQFSLTIGFLLTAIFLIIELPPKFQRSNKLLRQCDNLTILGSTFIYGSCPNNRYTNSPGLDAPVMKIAKSCTDSIGGRINCLKGDKKFNKDFYNIYLIGDSFVQAAEVNYDETVYGLINQKKSTKEKAYGLGFSSWNTRQYLQAIESINKKNSNYDIYLFINDFAPNYNRSTYGEEYTKPIKKNLFELTLKPLLLKSITIRKYLAFKLRNNPSISSQDLEIRQKYWSYHQKRRFGECPSPTVREMIYKFTGMVKDFIMYSYHYDCWDEKQKKAYSLVSEDLKKVLKVGNKLNSNVRLVWIPPGFSFPSENTPGRLSNWYGIPDSVRLSFIGLREKLSQDFKKNFLDIEDSLNKQITKNKKECDGNCRNLFYFAYDGHFNKKGHQYLYEEIYSK